MMARSASSRHAVESCTLQLHGWNPFQMQTLNVDSSTAAHYDFSFSKRQCRSDRSTATVENGIDFGRLSLVDDTAATRQGENQEKIKGLPWLERKRRRHGGSKSVSGRSSDRSGKRRTRRCCSVGAGGGGGASGAYATCSDFPVVAGGTDSSGELFMNGDGNWGSDASEKRMPGKEMKDVGGGVDRDGLGFVSLQGWAGVSDLLGNDSAGYGSETGYKGDAEFGYEDEIDEEEDDSRLLFWGDRFGDKERMEFAGKNVFSDLKSHPRWRRKKNMIEE